MLARVSSLSIFAEVGPELLGDSNEIQDLVV